MKRPDFSDPRNDQQGRGPNPERVIWWGLVDIVGCLMLVLIVWALATFGPDLRQWLGLV